MTDLRAYRQADKILTTVPDRPKIDVVDSNELLIRSFTQFDVDTILALRQLGWVDTKIPCHGRQDTMYEYRKTRTTTLFGAHHIGRFLYYLGLLGLSACGMLWAVFYLHR